MSVGKYVSVAARVRKAVQGLRLAAQNKRVFHLWTHPFNLGMRTPELLAGLEQIFQEARRLNETENLEIMSNGDLSQYLDGQLERQLPVFEKEDAHRQAATTSQVHRENLAKSL